MSEWPAPESTRYPERADPGVGWRQSLERGLLAWPARYRHLGIRRELAGLEHRAHETTAPVEVLRARMRLEGLTGKSLAVWHARARQQGANSDVLAGALALIREMAVQCDAHSLQAAMVAFASEAIALSGRAVQVLTPDDERSRELAPALQERLRPYGLQPGIIESDTPVAQRRKAYRAGVTVLSAREALRDYLNDRLQLHSQQGEIGRKLGRLVGHDPLQNTRMCGLPFGIIVDANRILIDQACEPLTVAGRTDPAHEKDWAETALALARDLVEGAHFTLEADRRIHLTETGRSKLEEMTLELPGAWRNAHRRNADITLALQALRLEPGRHYRLAGQRLELPPGTSTPDGMMQLLQAREGLPVTGRAVARGKLTFQRFFRRYESLAALCDDTRYIRDELWHIYGLPSFVVTPAAPKRVADDDLLSAAEKRLVDAVSGVSEPLGRNAGRALGAWRMRRRRKSAEQTRRSLLRHDNQTGYITAFSGRAE